MPLKATAKQRTVCHLWATKAAHCFSTCLDSLSLHWYKCCRLTSSAAQLTQAFFVSKLKDDAQTVDYEPHKGDVLSSRTNPATGNPNRAKRPLTVLQSTRREKSLYKQSIMNCNWGPGKHVCFYNWNLTKPGQPDQATFSVNALHWDDSPEDLLQRLKFLSF